MEAGSTHASGPRPTPVLRFAGAVAAFAVVDLVLRRGLARIATAVFDPRASLYAETAGRLVANLLALVTIVTLASLVRAVFREPALRLGPFRRMLVGGFTVVVLGTFTSALVLREHRFALVPMLALMFTGYGCAFVLSFTGAIRGVHGGLRLACAGLAVLALLGAFSSVSSLLLGLTDLRMPSAVLRPVESTLEVAYFAVPVGASIATAEREGLVRRLALGAGTFVLVFALGGALATAAPEAFASVLDAALHLGGVASLPPTYASLAVACAFGLAAVALGARAGARAPGLGALGLLATGIAPGSPLGIAVLVAASATLAAEPDARQRD